MRAVAILLSLLAAAAPLAAQCAMCVRNASAVGARGFQAMNLGILVLLLPLVAIAGGICWTAYRYRD